MPDEDKAPASSDVVIESFRTQMEILQLMRKDAKSSQPDPRSCCSSPRRTRGCAIRGRRTERTGAILAVSAPTAGRMPVLSEPRFQIVLLHPEIPNNTGAIGRTAAATGCRLHIVHPIGFDMGESARRRAGLDYWHLVDCVEHESWDAFVASEGLARRALARLALLDQGRPAALGGVLRRGRLPAVRLRDDGAARGGPALGRGGAQRDAADDRRAGRAQPQSRKRRLRGGLRGPAPARDRLSATSSGRSTRWPSRGMRRSRPTCRTRAHP